MDLYPLLFACACVILLLREAHHAAVKGAANDVAWQCSEYVGHLSRATIAGRTKSGWLQSRKCAEHRQDLLTALIRYHGKTNKRFPADLIISGIPALQDADTWERLESFFEGAREERRKGNL